MFCRKKVWLLLFAVWLWSEFPNLDWYIESMFICTMPYGNHKMVRVFLVNVRSILVMLFFIQRPVSGITWWSHVSSIQVTFMGTAFALKCRRATTTGSVSSRLSLNTSFVCSCPYLSLWLAFCIWHWLWFVYSPRSAPTRMAGLLSYACSLR